MAVLFSAAGNVACLPVHTWTTQAFACCTNCIHRLGVSLQQWRVPIIKQTHYCGDNSGMASWCYAFFGWVAYTLHCLTKVLHSISLLLFYYKLCEIGNKYSLT